MKTDPYAALYETMRSASSDMWKGGGLQYRLATVLAADPFSLDVCGTTQEAARFYICERLLKGHLERCNAEGDLSISASCPRGSHSSMTVFRGTLELTNVEPVLKAGDLVLLLTDDDQTFILIDKVVHL